MQITDIIAKKRDALELTQQEIDFFANAAADSSVPDYQLSALLMAIYINGMTENETAALTLSMAKSGDMLDLSGLGDKTVDKHSTGGVGDKTTLICAPIAAALGCTVAKMSGRGLGHTGGTVDKLEAIAGFKTSLTPDEFIGNAQKIGLCVVGQSGKLAPADKKLYALRDVTATVSSIPLIASSIMSKKIAAGNKNIVLDIKYGRGAFMDTAEKAELLAREMVKIGKNLCRNVTAVITDMDTPLGTTVGNELEVMEALEILQGGGDSRLKELCIKLAANMYSLCFNTSLETGEEKAKAVLQNGLAYKKLLEAVSLQGGDISSVCSRSDLINRQDKLELYSESSGYICAVDSMIVGKAAALSGAGRRFLEDEIDLKAGIVLNKSYGDTVQKGEFIATVYGKSDRINAAAELLKTAFSVSADKPCKKPLIKKIISEV